MDDTVPELAEVSAPETEVTTAPETVENTETSEDQQAEQAPKTFTQEELDAAIGKRLAREQRKWERDQAQRLADQQARQQPTQVDPDDFATTDEYIDAVAERKAAEMLARREADQQQRSLVEAYQDREEEVRDKYADFQQVAYNPNLPVTDAMAKAMMAADNGPEVLYHLGSNPQEAARISRLDPILQAREIGKIEMSLAAAPPVKKTSTAPAPIAPVTARATSTQNYDTTDPRSIKSMSTSEWIEADRQRQLKRYEAARNR